MPANNSKVKTSISGSAPLDLGPKALPLFVRTPARVQAAKIVADTRKQKGLDKAPAKKDLMDEIGETLEKVNLIRSEAAQKIKVPTAKGDLDFIGTFPLRRSHEEKKIEAKKTSTGPVFNPGEYEILTRNSPLSKAITEEFQRYYLSRHMQDKLHWKGVYPAVGTAEGTKDNHTQILFEKLANKDIDLVILNMKEIPLELPQGLVLAASLKREDPRDAMVTRSTYGAIRELPRNARVGANSKRRVMQLRNIRPDLEIVSIKGDILERLSQLESEKLDAVLIAWSGLKRLNISPRFYVALQPEHMLPAVCQGIAGVICRSDDLDLVAKLNYIEDSEASWATRCERAFTQKLGSFGDAPIGAHAHRKGTQDPWILDCIIGDARSGEVLKHREIGTSRCKPESLADKAFVGIVAKGARKFVKSEF